MTDVNVDPTEQLLAEADEWKFKSLDRFESNKLIEGLAAALRATRTELETARTALERKTSAMEGAINFWQTAIDQETSKHEAAETTLQQAQQLARAYRETNGYPAVTYTLIDLLLKDEP